MFTGVELIATTIKRELFTNQIWNQYWALKKLDPDFVDIEKLDSTILQKRKRGIYICKHVHTKEKLSPKLLDN